MPENDNILLTWDEAEKRFYNYGVSHVVLYKKDNTGAYKNANAWNGVTNISDNPTGADSNKLFADGIEYAALRAAEQYEGSIEAFQYPDAFAECDGSVEPVAGVHVTQQKRVPFALCWRSEVGNAEDMEVGYILHLAYGLTASPSERSYDTVNDSPDAQTMSWDTEGSPVPFSLGKPTCKLTVDSRTVDPTKLAAFLEIIYGKKGSTSTQDVPARLPFPDEVVTLLTADDPET